MLGTKGATNSIGKSTTLMILDFVFGGDDYTKLCADVKKHIEDHEFKFAFEFNGKRHYYRRGTKSPNEIYVCNEHYESLEPMPIKDFRDSLARAYGVEDIGVSWREVVSGAFRIWQRDNDKTSLPLSTHRTDTHRHGIERLLALFGKLQEIKDALDAETAAKAATEAAKNAPQYFGVQIAATASEMETNLKRIAELQQQLAAIRETLESTSESEMTAEQAKIVADLRRQQTPLYRQRTILTHQLDALRMNSHIAGKRKAKDIIEPLREFFPESELKGLEQVEQFRTDVKDLVAKHAKKEIKEKEEKLRRVERRLEELDEQIGRITLPRAVTIKAADTYHDLMNEIAKLRAANNRYEKKREYEDRKAEAKRRIEVESKDLLAEVQKRLNAALKEIDGQFTKDKRKQPKIKLDSIDKYSYAIADDTGTGSGYRSLVSFDLALLRETKLPVLIEDSMMFKQIETDAVELILAYYAAIKDKQIFISLDEIDKYKEPTQELINAHTVLRLATGEEALFGWEWGKKGAADAQK